MIKNLNQDIFYNNIEYSLPYIIYLYEKQYSEFSDSSYLIELYFTKQPLCTEINELDAAIKIFIQ